MTVVTPHLRVPTTPDRRQTDILEAVHGTFVEKGFDGASMQDLARAAGMSVGNFYRYFESKDAIVEALIAYDIAPHRAGLRGDHRSDKPLDALRDTLRRACRGDELQPRRAALGRDHGGGGPQAARGRGAVADGGRHPPLSDRGVSRACTGLPPPRRERRYRGHASLIMMLVKAQRDVPADTWHPAG